MLLAHSWQLHVSIYLISILMYKRPNSLRMCYTLCTLTVRSWQAESLVGFSIILRCGGMKEVVLYCCCWLGSFHVMTCTKTYKSWVHIPTMTYMLTHPCHSHCIQALKASLYMNSFTVRFCSILHCCPPPPPPRSLDFSSRWSPFWMENFEWME